MTFQGVTSLKTKFHGTFCYEVSRSQEHISFRKSEAFFPAAKSKHQILFFQRFEEKFESDDLWRVEAIGIMNQGPPLRMPPPGMPPPGMGQPGMGPPGMGPPGMGPPGMGPPPNDNGTSQMEPMPGK